MILEFVKAEMVNSRIASKNLVLSLLVDLQKILKKKNKFFRRILPQKCIEKEGAWKINKNGMQRLKKNRLGTVRPDVLALSEIETFSAAKI